MAAQLAEIASAVPDTASPAPRIGPPSRRRARLVTALVLLVVAGAAGAYFESQRVGPPGPELTPGTVSVPAPAGVMP